MFINQMIINTKGFKKLEEKFCQICNCQGKINLSMHVVKEHIVNICTKFELNWL